jgi:hypothetical protein
MNSVSCENETLYSIKACWTWHRFLHAWKISSFPFQLSLKISTKCIFLSLNNYGTGNLCHLVWHFVSSSEYSTETCMVCSYTVLHLRRWYSLLSLLWERQISNIRMVLVENWEQSARNTVKIYCDIVYYINFHIYK